MIDFLVRQDIALLNFLRSFIDPDSAWQVGLIRFGTDVEVIIVMCLLVGLWLYGTYRKNDSFKVDSLMIFYSLGFAFLIYVVLNLGLPFRPRPESVLAIRPLMDHLPDNSFPSGHAIFAGASILGAFLYTRGWIAWTLLVTGLLMVFSRVLAGIHYPLDITAGLMVGLVGAWIVYKLRDTKLTKDYFLFYPVKIASFFKL